MPKIDCFSIPGLDLWWWSDDHEPHHFHAERSGEWQIRVFFLADRYDIKWGQPRAKQLR